MVFASIGLWVSGRSKRTSKRVGFEVILFHGSSFTVRLAENPLTLRGWSIIDNRGNKVDVSLADLKTGVQLADSLFKYDGPDAGAIRSGGANRN